MKKLSIILVIVGIMVGVSPLVGQLYTKYQEVRMMAEWLDNEDVAPINEEAAADPEEGYSQLEEAFAPEGSSVEEMAEEDETPVSDQSKSAAKPAKAVKSVPKQNVLGIIQINKIKVKAPIVEGVTASNLKAGVGHIPGTAALGQPGNSALAGHRSYTFGKFFNRLDELVVGDEITITTKKEDLKYKVYKKVVVKPDDVSVLRGRKDDNIITLITCTPVYVATHRLIVHARLVNKTLKEP